MTNYTHSKRSASETREEALLRFWNQEHPRYTFDASHLTRGGGLPDVNKLDELGQRTSDFRSRDDVAVYEDGNNLYVVKMFRKVPMAAEVSRPNNKIRTSNPESYTDHYSLLLGDTKFYKGKHNNEKPKKPTYSSWRSEA